MTQENLTTILENLLQIKNEIDETISLIELEPGKTIETLNKFKNSKTTEYFEEDSKIIEGIFNGEIMIGPDSKQYSIPANYISKSKIVEGDKMKLTIKKDGTFIYKQIEQIDRTRLIGKLIKDETNKGFAVLADSKVYRVQKASVTYFKGDVGDEVIIIIPSNKNSIWAAIENITNAKGLDKNETEEESENLTWQSPIETLEEVQDKNETTKTPQKLNIATSNQITPISLDDIK